MTCDCTGLRAELERARATLAKVAPAIIRGGLDLSSETQARMIYRLYRAAPGDWIPLYELEMAVDAAMPNENTTRVYVGRIRDALGDGYIENKRKAGYRLSADARDQVRAIMGD